MKKIFVLMASAAVLFAACNKMEEVNTPVDTPVETETITVVLNPVTKTSLGANGTTTWSANDAVDVIYDGNTVVGTLTHVGDSKFTGELTTVGLTGEVTLHYPADVDAVPTTQTAVAGSFADDAAILEGTVDLDVLRAGEGASLSNTTALLQFTSPLKGDVAFTIGSTTYTVEGCEADETYYACVDPANSGKLSYTVGIVLGANEKDDFAPVANKVYPLGDLTLKESKFGVVGDYSGDSWGTDTKMYETIEDNLFVAYGVKFTAAGRFKVREAGGWKDDYNFGTTSTAIKSANSTVGVYTDGGSGDIKVAANTYDIYFSRIKGQVYIMEEGKSYTEATAPTTVSDKYSLIGTIGSSNWDKDFYMEYSGDNIWTLVYTFAANNEWKVRKNTDWGASWGYDNVWPGNGNASNSGGNIKMKSAGTFVVGFVPAKNKITLVTK